MTREQAARILDPKTMVPTFIAMGVKDTNRAVEEAICMAREALRSMDADWQETADDCDGKTLSLSKRGQNYILETSDGMFIAEFAHYEEDET